MAVDADGDPNDALSSLAHELLSGLPYASYLTNTKSLSNEDVISYYRILPLASPSGQILHFLVLLEFVKTDT